MLKIRLIILAVIIIVEHLTIGRWIKRYEVAITIATVLGWSYPIALEEYGAYGEDVWQTVASGFLVVGIMHYPLKSLLKA